MPNYHRVAKKIARHYGIPPRLFLSLISHESGWNPQAVSPAGAIGFSQLMPGTAQGLGVDPHNPRQNLVGGARYLAQQYKTFGSWRKALAAYNAGPGAVTSGAWLDYPETTNYVKNVLSAAGGRGRLGPTPTSRRASRGFSVPTSGMGDLIRQNALESLGAIASGQPVSPLDQLSSLAQAVAMEPEGQGRRVQGGGRVDGGKLDVSKWVTLSSGADREGVSTKRPVLKFAAKIARLYGSPLTIGTGTNHNQYTVDGNVSAHWTGRAADIPATGAELRKLGFYALRAAGVTKKKARAMAAQGGLFNVGRYQIIFLTNEGGNHYNHLHIGIRS